MTEVNLTGVSVTGEDRSVKVTARFRPQQHTVELLEVGAEPAVFIRPGREDDGSTCVHILAVGTSPGHLVELLRSLGDAVAHMDPYATETP